MKLPAHEGKGATCATSPPARGAWIEITAEKVLTELETVAPRTGGVD